MKKHFQYSLALLGLGALMTPSIHALIGPALTTGGSTTQTFLTVPLSRSYHKPSGTLVAGLTASVSTDNNVLCYASRPSSPDTAPTFTGIAGSSILSGNRIQQVQVIQNPASRSDFNTAYILTTTGATATTLLCLTPTAQNNAPQAAALSAAITFTITGGVYSDVGYGFAAYKGPGGAYNDFGALATDGVAIAKIDATTLAMTTATLATPATSAAAFFAGGANATATGSPSIAYSEALGKVYIAAGQLVSGSAFNNSICNVAMLTVADTPSLTNGTFTGAAISTVMSFSSIVGSRVNGSGAVTNSINRIRVMQTSTAPAAGTTNYAYLIVNGGTGATTAVGNKVYAVPLVVNNATPANNGKLASIGTQTTYPFDTPVAAVGDLYTTVSVQAIVGNGDLPMAATATISDMWVDGDAVYCSIGGTATATNCSGVWKSQAMFDNLGRVAYWTDWEKVTPEGYSTTSDLQTAVASFAVDAYTGQIWGINNAGTNLYLTGWNNTAVSTAGLVGFLNSNLGSGCFSALDMNSSVTGWGASTSQRMALFGGLNTVCFAITGSATYGRTTSPLLAFGNGANSSLTSTATTVLTSAYLDTLDNYVLTGTNIGLVTTGLPGRVNCLGYTGWDALNASNTTPAFFLAGIQPEDAEDGGLYAYATSAGRGFNPTTQISDLANGFFASSNSNSWQELTNVVGTPVKILSRGGALYVLTQSVSDEGGRTDYIYRATICDTVTNLNNSFVAIATTGVAPSGTSSSLASVGRIYDFLITSTCTGTAVTPTGAEQITMLTNDGIYTTTCSVGTQANFGSISSINLQLVAGWAQLADSDTYIEMMMSEPDRQRNPHVYWFSSFVPDTNDYYNSQVMTQLNSNYTTFSGTFTANPSYSKSGIFNSDSTTKFETLPLMRSIYSDGSRRFFVQASDPFTHYLTALPYNVGSSAWNVLDPQAPISSSALSGAKAFYWIAQIGSSGKLMVGTDTGVASLE